MSFSKITTTQYQHVGQGASFSITMAEGQPQLHLTLGDRSIVKPYVKLETMLSKLRLLQECIDSVCTELEADLKTKEEPKS